VTSTVLCTKQMSHVHSPGCDCDDKSLTRRCLEGGLLPDDVSIPDGLRQSSPEYLLFRPMSPIVYNKLKTDGVTTVTTLSKHVALPPDAKQKATLYDVSIVDKWRKIPLASVRSCLDDSSTLSGLPFEPSEKIPRNLCSLAAGLHFVSGISGTVIFPRRHDLLSPVDWLGTEKKEN